MTHADSGRGDAGTRPAPSFDLVVFDLDGTLVAAMGGRRHDRVPGSAQVLATLRAAGVRLAVASLCGRGFLHDGLERLGLAAEVDGARCLDHAGCSDKGVMVAQLLEQFGTRSAVVVGDARGDGAAAKACGLPFVHFLGTGANPAAVPFADAAIDRLTDLPRVLDGRPRRMRELWAELGEPEAVAVLAADGDRGDLFARDLARALAVIEVEAAVVERRSEPGRGGEGAELEALAAAAGQGPTVAWGAAADTGWPAGLRPAVVHLEGHPAQREARLRLDCADQGPEALGAALERAERQAAGLAECAADLVIDAERPLDLMGRPAGRP